MNLNTKQKICGFIAHRVLGWKLDGEVPHDLDKFLFVALPHTSNWDFVLGWLVAQGQGLELSIFAKDTFYRWPLNYACDFFGVRPINRRERTNFVDSLVEEYRQADKLVAVITPEGTRSLVETVKSGYYYIAKNADIPIVLAGADYPTKTVELTKPRMALESFEQDCADLIAFCKTKRGKHVEKSF